MYKYRAQNRRVTGHHYRVLAQNKVNNVLAAAFGTNVGGVFSSPASIVLFLLSKNGKGGSWHCLATSAQLWKKLEPLPLSHRAKTKQRKNQKQTNNKSLCTRLVGFVSNTEESGQRTQRRTWKYMEEQFSYCTVVK